MFHYRWAYAPDTKKASAYLPYGQMIQMTREQGGEPDSRRDGLREIIREVLSRERALADHRGKPKPFVFDPHLR